MSRLVSTPPLVPSSMSAGNTVSDDASLAMSAPGSPSVNSYAEVATDRLPLPVASDTLDVNPQRTRIPENPLPGGDGPWVRPAETWGPR